MTTLKRLVYTLFIMIAFTLSLVAEDNEIKIATWNIRDLNKEKPKDALSDIANIMKSYDIIAVQEAEEVAPLFEIMDRMPGYRLIFSKRVGGSLGYGEHYAFFYKASKVELKKNGYIFDDSADEFVREPFIASFKSGNFDFTLINIHVLYGGRDPSKRRKEIEKLDDIINYVQMKNADEEDVILIGDFNFPRDDIGWQIKTHRAIVGPSQKTMIRDSSSYDNIWINPKATYEYKGVFEVYKYDEVLYNNNDSLIQNKISDHRPVYAVFNTSLADDDGKGKAQQNENLRIESVVAHPTENEEVKIVNYSSRPINLNGYTLGDANKPEAYKFSPEITLKPNQTYTIKKSELNFSVNNYKETIYLKNPKGKILDTWNN